eukprot:358162-Chlamydomonas_euryale.AAC.10
MDKSLKVEYVPKSTVLVWVLISEVSLHCELQHHVARPRRCNTTALQHHGPATPRRCNRLHRQRHRVLFVLGDQCKPAPMPGADPS